MAVKHEWPFKVPMGEVRILGDVPKLEFSPIDLPPAMQEVQSKCRINRSVSPVPVKILSIDGVPKRDTYMFLRPVTLNKIMEAVRKSDKPQQEDLS
jgi:hypothetical protein